MKKTPLVVLSCVAFTVLALSTQRESLAAPQGGQPPTGPIGTALPRPMLDPLPSIAGFSFFGGGATSKPNLGLKSIAYEVPVRVSGTNARTGKLQVKRNGNLQLNAPFTIASGETKTIPVVDSVGMEHSCQAAHLDLQLEGNGFDVKKTATVTPTCTYQSATVNPISSAPPDAKKDHVYFADVGVFFAAIAASPTATISANGPTACNSRIVFKTTVKNALPHAVSGMLVRITMNGQVKGVSTPIALAAGQSTDVTVLAKFEGEAGAYGIELADPNNAASGAIIPSSFHVDMTRSCSLTAALDP